jgi:hypothetical protein
MYREHHKHRKHEDMIAWLCTDPLYTALERSLLPVILRTKTYHTTKQTYSQPLF